LLRISYAAGGEESNQDRNLENESYREGTLDSKNRKAQGRKTVSREKGIAAVQRQISAGNLKTLLPKGEINSSRGKRSRLNAGVKREIIGLAGFLGRIVSQKKRSEEEDFCFAGAKRVKSTKQSCKTSRRGVLEGENKMLTKRQDYLG